MSGPRIGSLCSGYGGLDLAAEELLGGTVAWVADPMPASRVVLAERYPDAPNLGDLTAVDWSTVEPVDVLTAGWPCQPFSLAGKRKGSDDLRAIWPAIARAVRDLGPLVVLLENVAAVIAVGELARAVGDLADLGYDAEWLCLRASDVGAPHGRNRCFIAATHADGPRFALPGRRPESVERPAAQRDRAAPPDPVGSRRDGRTPEPERREIVGAAAPRDRGRAAPDPDGRGLPQLPELDSDEAGDLGASLRDDPVGPHSWGVYRPAIDRWAAVVGRPAPAPTALGRRGARQLSPAFVEWMMGLPDGWVTAVPGLTRAQQLTLLGNGVVPAQAVAAYRELISR